MGGGCPNTSVRQKKVIEVLSAVLGRPSQPNSAKRGERLKQGLDAEILATLMIKVAAVE